MSQQVSLWRRQLVDSEARVRSVEAELQRARAHAGDVEACYRFVGKFVTCHSAYRTVSTTREVT